MTEQIALRARRRYRRRYKGKRPPKCRTKRCGTCWRCRSRAGLRDAYASGRRPRYIRKHNEWTAAEEKRLGEIVGTMPLAEVAAALTREFFVRRTVYAVRTRAEDCGFSTAWRGRTQTEVLRLFGVGEPTVHAWRLAGLLTPRYVMAGKWVYPDADVEAFVRAYPWAYDRERIADRRLRALAEVQERWLTRKEAAKAVGLSPSGFEHWVRLGVVREKALSRNWRRVRAADVPAIRDEIERRTASRKAG